MDSESYSHTVLQAKWLSWPLVAAGMIYSELYTFVIQSLHPVYVKDSNCLTHLFVQSFLLRNIQATAAWNTSPWWALQKCQDLTLTLCSEYIPCWVPMSPMSQGWVGSDWFLIFNPIGFSRLKAIPYHSPQSFKWASKCVDTSSNNFTIHADLITWYLKPKLISIQEWWGNQTELHI